LKPKQDTELTMENKQASTTTDNNTEDPNLNHLEAATATATAATDEVTTSTDNNIEEPNRNHLEAATSTATATATIAETKDDNDDDDDDDDDWKIQRDESKAAGDAAFREADYTTAANHYSAALSVDPDNATLLSNRSAAYLKSSQKSKALHDAQKCVNIGTMGYKGHSRLAAALQSLGRYEQALDSWNVVLKQDPNNQAALKGVQDCQAAAEEKASAAAAVAAEEAAEEAAAAEEAEVEAESTVPDKEEQPDAEEDDLDDFFNDVEVATSTVAKEKEELAIEKPAVATNRIASHKKDLGTAADQIKRLLQENYKWRNLNPFHILDVPHTASSDDISRRFKALSLLVSPTSSK
jgi:tetratricopeptide (TPR) repeat protein